MSALPVPDGGWSHLLRSVIAVGLLWATAAWAATALLLPRMDPQCYSNDVARICPLHPDPALTHLFDSAWPQVTELWGFLVVVVPMVSGIGIALFIDTSEPWAEAGGAPPVTGSLSGLTGTGLGLLIAGPGFARPLVVLGIAGGGLLLMVLGLLGVRRLREELRRRAAAHERRARLEEHGTRTIARITALEWQQAYRDDDPVFTVTAAFGPAPDARTVTGELCVPREDAPVVGGTVVVVHDEERGHPTGIDLLLSADPDGLRDPEALEKYPEAPKGSPS